MNHLLRIADLEADALRRLLDAAARFKADPGAFAGVGSGRVVGILFEKPSLRTRFSIESALGRLGAHPVGAYDAGAGIGTREPVGDAARVLSRYADVLVMRTFEHDRVTQLAEASDVPVINALSDAHHPLQALADLQTIVEGCCGGDIDALKSFRLAYVGDGNNVANSLIEAAAITGMSLACACPRGYEPDPGIVAWARDHGGMVELTHEPSEAVAGAGAVYTDVWASMGQEAQAADRRRIFAPYQVTRELMAVASQDAIFLHCLPAHRGEEVTADVIDGPASRVFDQAANRMHTAAAVFCEMWGDRDAA